MHFCGGGVRHSSMQAATDIFKNDQDSLDKKSQQVRKEANAEEDEATGEDEMDTEGLGGESEREEEVDKEVSELELVDYGYQLESESEEEEEEEEDREAGKEDNTTVDELGILGYADY